MSFSLESVETLLLFPLKPELKHFLVGLDQENISCQQIENGHWIPSQNTMLAVGGHGKTEFGVQATKLLGTLPNCKRLLCLGVSGSLVEEVKPKDVVIGSSTIEHDYSMGFGNVHGPPEFESQLLKAMNTSELPNLESFQVHLEKIASGDEDITTRQRASEVHELTKAKCVAWEGVGGARAARAFGLPYLEIRAVSDVCDENVASNFKENLPQAMINLCTAYLTLIISK